jgi:glucokinase
MGETAVGVDLGGTNIKVGLVTASGNVVARHATPTHADGGFSAVAVRMCDAVRECVRRAGERLESVAGVGVGSPGTIDHEAGVVCFSPNLPGWRDVPLRETLAEELGVRCVIENDANAAALAEQWLGAGKGERSLVLLTLGTGIGGGIVLDGHVWHGASGAAGEIGHMCIDPDGPQCNCGNRGCLETYASATGMVRRMREAIERGADCPLAADPDALTARRIYEAAVGGDTAARRVVEDTGRYLGVAASNIMHALNPNVIAFSGGVTGAGEMLMGPLLREAEWRTLEQSRRGVRICFSALGDDAGILGAARSLLVAPA